MNATAPPCKSGAVCVFCIKFRSMKAYKLILFFTVFALFATGCTRRTVVHKRTVVVKPLPPGQAKKLTGSKSAKPYAPGQRKKKMRGH